MSLIKKKKNKKGKFGRTRGQKIEREKEIEVA